jgi:hypothetical protein
MQTERACAGANVPLYMRKCCLSKGTWCLYEGFGMVVIQRYRTKVKGTGLGLNSANQHQRRMSALGHKRTRFAPQKRKFMSGRRMSASATRRHKVITE